ncbi:MAG: diaminopimelate epimerase [Burkholderiaceae bacterium]
MKLRFTKMHGAGNDFVVLDATRAPLTLGPAQWRLLADRHFGVGADQMLVVESADGPDVDFVYRIFNADGDEVEQCGNGARCFARFVFDSGLTDKTAIRVRTLGGIIRPRLEGDGRVTVDMGRPAFGPQATDFDANGLESVQAGEDTLWPVDPGTGKTSLLSLVSMGNPHAVQVVSDVDTAAVLTEGPRLESHPRFLRRVNAGFMQVIDRSHVRLRVFERGVGETLACGTGACAAVVAGIRRGLLDSRVDVQTRGGILSIEWQGDSVMMTGPAVTLYAGEFDLDAAWQAWPPAVNPVPRTP